MLDIDHFKQFNDTYGHSAGDQLLVDVSQIISREIRYTDVGVRFGGEEFIIILPNTDVEKATEVAERLRTGIAEQEFSHNGDLPLHVTVSLGIAMRTKGVPVADRLIMMADDALYEAKRSGRNRVVLWSPSPVKVQQQMVEQLTRKEQASSSTPHFGSRAVMPETARIVPVARKI